MVTEKQAFKAGYLVANVFGNMVELFGKGVFFGIGFLTGCKIYSIF